MDPPAVLLYDGECGFCTRSVLFVHRRDPRGRVRFASLQSARGRALLAQHGVAPDMSTVVLLDGKGAHLRSTAIVRTARLLRWPWSWAYAAVLVPRPLRDALYRFVARHRHRFGPAVEACANPTPELRARMLDD
ncbi:MAG TPA: DCC1-like thiol-disulfide oxidoreductase family protein [Candidatus Thermoplasmatota archaeon]|nr:DCC1-like thiol-disulfide oxidoreductase family protein [Candidatus Thermoplasmatota archaeon]